MSLTRYTQGINACYMDSMSAPCALKIPPSLVDMDYAFICIQNIFRWWRFDSLNYYIVFTTSLQVRELCSCFTAAWCSLWTQLMQFEVENSVNLYICSESLWNYISKQMYLEAINTSLPHYILLHYSKEARMVFAPFLPCVAVGMNLWIIFWNGYFLSCSHSKC